LKSGGEDLGRGRPLDSGLLPLWALVTFGAALGARLTFLFVVDEPLLYTHQYTYFRSALRIAESPHPISYLLRSDEWRNWGIHWTIAPLYFWFAAAIFKLMGPHLLPLRLAQCVLDSIAAVLVGALGRRVAGEKGWWAGLAYGLYWPAIEMTSWTMTENVHTPLLLISFVLATKEPEGQGKLRSAAAGFALGLSALARSVSSAFLAVVALWRISHGGWRRAWPAAAFFVGGGAAALLPWAARNVFIMHEPMLIETAAFENIWYANNFVGTAEHRRQEEAIARKPTSAAKREAAVEFAKRGILDHPGLFREKVSAEFWHFLRPEGLHNLVTIERSLEPWRHCVSILFDDLPLLATLPLYLVFVIAGRTSPTRTLIALWSAYYLLMVVVIFHNEIRYRSAFVPFVFAGASGGLVTLSDRGRVLRARLSLYAGLLLVLLLLSPFVLPSWRALVAAQSLIPAAAAVRSGRLIEGNLLAANAAAKAPDSPRPWFRYGRWLVDGGYPREAVDAYRRGAKRATPANWIPVLVLPRLLEEAGLVEESEKALLEADSLSWNSDPWLPLEVAWRAMPPPRCDEIVLGKKDYGAVRGFFHPRGDYRLSQHRREWNDYSRGAGPFPPPGAHRWSRAHAWLRLVPTTPANDYDVALAMGSPFPSPQNHPEVTVQLNEGEAMQLTLDTQIRTYTFRVHVRPDEPIVVHLRAPTWNRQGEPAEQGVRVDRMAVVPSS